MATRLLPAERSVKRAPTIWSPPKAARTYFSRTASGQAHLPASQPRRSRLFKLSVVAAERGGDRDFRASPLARRATRAGAAATDALYAPHAYFSRASIARHLSHFFDRFPREQMLVLRYEDVVPRPEQIAVTFQRFAGVTEIPGLTRDLGPINATEAPPPQFLPCSPVAPTGRTPRCRRCPRDPSCLEFRQLEFRLTGHSANPVSGDDQQQDYSGLVHYQACAGHRFSRIADSAKSSPAPQPVSRRSGRPNPLASPARPPPMHAAAHHG